MTAVNRAVKTGFWRGLLYCLSGYNMSPLSYDFKFLHLCWLISPRQWDVGLQSWWAWERLSKEAHQSWPPCWPAANWCCLQLQEEQEDLSLCWGQILEVRKENAYAASCKPQTVLWDTLAYAVDVKAAFWSPVLHLDWVSVWWDINWARSHKIPVSPCTTWEFIVLMIQNLCFLWFFVFMCVQKKAETLLKRCIFA